MLLLHALLFFLLGTSALAIPVPFFSTGKTPPKDPMNGLWRSKSEILWSEVSEQHSLNLAWY
jgi:hypothetical protein